MSLCRDCAVGLLGACNGDYCRAEREPLLEEAQLLAEQHAHVLTDWAKQKGVPVWQACGQRCGRGATINLDPAPGEFALEGNAITQDCVSASA